MTASTSPLRIASSVSWASRKFSCRRASSSAVIRWAGLLGRRAGASGGEARFLAEGFLMSRGGGQVRVRREVELDQQLLAVGEIAHHPHQGTRQHFDQGGRRNDLSGGGARWFLIKIDHFEIVAARQEFVAQGAKIRDRLGRT